MDSTVPLMTDTNMVEFYRFRVLEAKEHYDEAMKDMIRSEKSDEDVFEIDTPRTEACREICLDLLQHPELPHEFRALLSMFMSDTCEDDFDLSSSYLRQALSAVVSMENLKPGVEVPARAVIETKLQWINDHTTKSTDALAHGGFEDLDPQLSFGSDTGPSEGSTRLTTATNTAAGSFTEGHGPQPAHVWMEGFAVGEGKVSDGEDAEDIEVDDETVKQ